MNFDHVVLILAVCFGLIIIASFVLLELAKGKPSRTPEGAILLRSNGDNWVINYFYGLNIFGSALGDVIKKPKNICTLFWGIFAGLSLFWMTFTMAVVAYCFTFLINLAIGFVFLLFMLAGWLPHWKNIHFFMKLSNISDMFDMPEPKIHPYQRWGKENQRKFIAPWKIIMAVLGLIYWRPIVNLPAQMGEQLQHNQTLQNLLFYLGASALCLLFLAGLAILIFQFRDDINSFILELVRGWKNKYCTIISYQEEETKAKLKKD